MTYSVVWSTEASDSFESIVSYIFQKWGIKAAQKFELKVKEIVKLISLSPSSFQAGGISPNFKKVLVSKQTYLFYEIARNEIVLLYFWENARNPDSFPL